MAAVLGSGTLQYEVHRDLFLRLRGLKHKLSIARRLMSLSAAYHRRHLRRFWCRRVLVVEKWRFGLRLGGQSVDIELGKPACCEIAPGRAAGVGQR